MTVTDFLLLLGRTVLPLGVLWALYHLGLRHERCYRYNRALLLLAPLLALALVLLPGWLPLGWLPEWLSGWLPAPAGPASGLPTVLLPAIGSHAGAALPAPIWPPALLGLYGLGVALGLGRLAWHLGRLRRLARTLPAETRPGYRLARTGGRLPTSSFGRTVFWDDTAALPPAEAGAVLAHELAHVRQGHSRDVLWLEMWRALLWFNPFAHGLLPALRLTHELLADAAAAPGPAAPAYSALLARLAVRRLAGPGYLTLLQPFTSFTLTRIAMLKSQIPVRRWKQWLLLPVLAALFVVACRTADVRPATAGPAAPGEPVNITSPAYRADDKAAFRQAWRTMRREDSVRNGEADLTRYEMNFNIKPVPGQPGMQVSTLIYVLKSQRKSEQIDAVSTDPKVYVSVEQMPRLPGAEGTEAIVNAIQANLEYPHGPDGKPLPEARAYVSFNVAADGAVEAIKVVKSAGPAYDLAVLAAIQKLPRFEPGRQDGKPVIVAFTVPVIFKPQP